MAAPPPKFGDTLGAMLLGNMITSILYGITTIQTYTYYKCEQTDQVFMKLLVAFLWFLSSAHLVLITYTTYNYTVIDFSNPLAVENVIWSVPLLVLVTTLSDFTIRILFCRRIWLLNEGKWHLALINTASALCNFGSGLAIVVKGFSLASINSTSQPVFSRIVYLAFGTVAVGDCLIAATLAVLLSRRRTGFPSSDSTIKSLMFYSIQTCTLTSLCSIACFIAFATMHNNLVYVAIYFVISELFLNSLLASLNARRSLREKGAVVVFPLSNLSSSTGSTGHQTRASEAMLAHTRGICVETSIHKHDDSVIHIGDLDGAEAKDKDITPA